MNATFENFNKLNERREERNRRLAELEAAYDAAVTGNTRAFHERMEAADAYLLDRQNSGGNDDDDDEQRSAWLGYGAQPPEITRCSFLMRANYYIKARWLHLLLSFMFLVAVAFLTIALATPAMDDVSHYEMSTGHSEDSSNNSLINIYEGMNATSYARSRAPSASDASISRSDYFRSIIVQSRVTALSLLLDEDSPQGRAFSWLLEDDSVSFYRNSDVSIDATSISTTTGKEAIQRNAVLIRYALAVLYYSTTSHRNTDSFDFVSPADTDTSADERFWVRSDNWLKSTSVCSWYGITCSGIYDEIGNALFSFLTSIDAPKHTRSSTTFDMSYAFDSTLISLNLTANNLVGCIPSELFSGLGASLRFLDLSSNKLSSTIPTEIRQSTDISKIYLDSNALIGTIPPFTMHRLKRLRLEGNFLTGKIPEGMCILTSDLLKEFGADCVDKIECTCCTYCV